MEGKFMAFVIVILLIIAFFLVPLLDGEPGLIDLSLAPDPTSSPAPFQLIVLINSPVLSKTPTQTSTAEPTKPAT